MMEKDARIVAAQGGAVDHSTGRFRPPNLVLALIILRWRMIIP